MSPLQSSCLRPRSLPLRLTTITAATTTRTTQQTRSASLIKRPKRPYTFTQMITLSDGSTFLHRTTSPASVHKSTKDTKNHALWNPSSQKLLNVEDDEAGRLKRFRLRYTRVYDAETAEKVDGADEGRQEDESLLDLLSRYGKRADPDEGKQGDESPLDALSGLGKPADPSGAASGEKKAVGKK